MSVIKTPQQTQNTYTVGEIPGLERKARRKESSI